MFARHPPREGTRFSLKVIPGPPPSSKTWRFKNEPLGFFSPGGSEHRFMPKKKLGAQPMCG